MVRPNSPTSLLILLLVGLCIIATPWKGKTVEAANYTDSNGNTILENGTIIWGPLPAPSTPYKTNGTYDSGGLAMLFAFARSFVNTVQPNSLPFDMIQQLMAGTFDISSDYMELVNYAMGFAITFAIGILYVLFLPICGFCFCCCRCCGNCGGSSTQSMDENAGCKRMGYGLALFLMSLCMGAAMGCTYYTNERFNSALDAIGDNIDNNFDDIDVFLNNTAEQFKYMAVDMYAVTAQGIRNDLSGIGPILGGSIVSSLGLIVDPTLDSIINLHKIILNVVDKLDNVNTKISNVKTAGNDLNSALETLKDDITATKLGCSSCFPPQACNNVDESVLALGIDFETLPDLSGVSSSMSAITSQNLTQMALDGRAILDNIPTMINDTVGSLSDSVSGTMDEFSGMISGMVDGFINTTLGALDISAVKSDVGGYIDLAKDYNVYRWYGGLGLMGVFGLVIFCFLIGLFCGVAGYDKQALPTERGCMSNCGGCCLMLGVTIVFFVGSLLMLLTTVLFMVGGNMEKICQPLSDMTIFKDFLDKGGIPSFNLGEMLLSNSSVEFKLNDVFIGCRANQAPFRLMHFDSLIPLDDYLDYKKYLPDIDSQFDNMATSVNLSSIVIITPETEQLLVDFRDSGAGSIDFATFTSVLSLNLTSFDFTALSQVFRGVGDTCGASPVTQAQWYAHADEMDRINFEEKVTLSNAMANLTTALDGLQTAVDGIVPAVNGTLVSAVAMQTQIQTNATASIVTAAVGYKDRILGYIDQFATKALDLVNNELAACKPVWNLYESFTLILCKWTVDSLNGFWFGLGWGILFFVPCIFVAVKLAKHYRRMDDCEGFMEEDDFYDDHDYADDDYYKY
ncbi:unnamed protein product [Owenia fusiformis]|uniref:Prominin-1-A-like n=1 Tax=Owenia fusiformis TaxID=6347 RepID=A0A8S4NQD4_OWEFU|nr:unnamed protein product [Owenia fusiformis]